MEYIDIAASILSLIVVIISLVTIIKIKKALTNNRKAKMTQNCLSKRLNLRQSKTARVCSLFLTKWLKIFRPFQNRCTI